MSAPVSTAPAGAEAARRTQAPFGRRIAEIAENREVGAYRVLVARDAGGPPPRPGQFYMLAAVQRWGGGEEGTRGEAVGRPYLPRAFSVLRAGADESREFIVEDVGPGSRRLAGLGAGEGMWLTGPLGVGFSAPDGGRRPLLVGGGIGIAPLAIWQDELAGGQALLGFRDAAHAAAAELLHGARVATDDGSVGHHGLVTELLAAELDEDSRAMVYACGPPPMLEAVRELCAARGVPAQLAMESGMACGFGACFGCVVPTRDGYIRLCVDGPVVDAERIETALVPGTGH
jgi:dihydroorotate dehydrogenase electron transfer subunit